VGPAQGGPQEGLGKEGTERNVPPARRIRRARPNRNRNSGLGEIYFFYSFFFRSGSFIHYSKSMVTINLKVSLHI